MILGTAGHIDHGKTELIKALTGIDTDRLQEEKSRGISIDLGFAHLELPDGTVLGVVDVPGHELFIKNMLTGVGGIDLVLFVVACDESIMPQTREHFDIVSLLGVHHAIFALTKADLVDSDMTAIVRDEVEDLIASTPFAGSPIVVTSTKTGRGLDDLLSALEEVAARVVAVPEPPGHRADGPIEFDDAHVVVVIAVLGPPVPGVQVRAAGVAVRPRPVVIAGHHDHVGGPVSAAALMDAVAGGQHVPGVNQRSRADALSAPCPCGACARLPRACSTGSRMQAPRV